MLTDAFDALGIETRDNSHSNWISTSTKKNFVELNETRIEANLVPNVKGMGLQDAIFLLENAGLKVEVSGYGSVKSQSITPGKKVIKDSIIKIQLS